MSHRPASAVDDRGETGIVADRITHGFDGTGVLEDVCLRITRGETLAIIGPSGTGKTTLLRILGLFHRPMGGTVRLDGEAVWSGAERERLAARRRIGMVFQQANLFDASVRRNVSYGLRVRRSWTTRVRSVLESVFVRDTPERVEAVLDMVGLAEAAERNVGSLSGGEAQRVAFARAIAYDPEFLLLDEPTSDLDPRNTAVIEGAIETARSRGLGVVVATHDMHQASRVADRVAVLLDGRLIEVGPTERVFEDPADPRAKQFIEGELVY